MNTCINLCVPPTYTQGIRLSEPQAGSVSHEQLMEAKEKAIANLDPDRLIHAFDDKLQLIQKMLKEYQNEGKQVGIYKGCAAPS